MSDKQKLKRLLLRMYLLAEKREFKKVKILNLEFRMLQKKVFTSHTLGKEEEPFDKAANNILMATGNYSEEQRKIFLDNALKYINEIKV